MAWDVIGGGYSHMTSAYKGDRLHERDRDKGRGVENHEYFADVLCERPLAPIYNP